MGFRASSAMRVLSKAANNGSRISHSCTPKRPAVQAKSVPINILLNRDFSRFWQRTNRPLKGLVSVCSAASSGEPNQSTKARFENGRNCPLSRATLAHDTLRLPPLMGCGGWKAKAAKGTGRSARSRAQGTGSSPVHQAKVPPCLDRGATARSTPRGGS